MKYEDAHRRYEPLLRMLANDYFAPGTTFDDLLQEARVGLWKACRDYDPQGGSSFASFARLCVERQVITAVKTAKRRKHQVLSESVDLNGPIPGTVDSAFFADILPSPGQDPHAIMEARERLAELAIRVGALTDVEREAILHLANGGAYPIDPEGKRSKRFDNAVQRARKKLEAADTPASQAQAGVLLIDRSLHPTERDAIREAGRVRPGCEVVDLQKRKVRDGRVVSTRGRAKADGSLGRAVWAVELAA